MGTIAVRRNLFVHKKSHCASAKIANERKIAENVAFQQGAHQVKAKLLVLITAISCVIAVGCGGGGSAPRGQTNEAGSTPVARTGPVSTNKNDYPVFPNADAGADPSVPPEQGGKGFDGKGWETNTDF